MAASATAALPRANQRLAPAEAIVDCTQRVASLHQSITLLSKLCVNLEKTQAKMHHLPHDEFQDLGERHAQLMDSTRDLVAAVAEIVQKDPPAAAQQVTQPTVPKPQPVAAAPAPPKSEEQGGCPSYSCSRQPAGDTATVHAESIGKAVKKDAGSFTPSPENARLNPEVPCEKRRDKEFLSNLAAKLDGYRQPPQGSPPATRQELPPLIFHGRSPNKPMQHDSLRETAGGSLDKVAQPVHLLPMRPEGTEGDDVLRTPVKEAGQQEQHSFEPDELKVWNAPLVRANPVPRPTASSARRSEAAAHDMGGEIGETDRMDIIRNQAAALASSISSSIGSFFTSRRARSTGAVERTRMQDREGVSREESAPPVITDPATSSSAPPEVSGAAGSLNSFAASTFQHPQMPAPGGMVGGQSGQQPSVGPCYSHSMQHPAPMQQQHQPLGWAYGSGHNLQQQHLASAGFIPQPMPMQQWNSQDHWHGTHGHSTAPLLTAQGAYFAESGGPDTRLQDSGSWVCGGAPSFHASQAAAMMPNPLLGAGSWSVPSPGFGVPVPGLPSSTPAWGHA
mmetsp:Transcript_21935/g.51288  ORF Transcript_21935/g.51288 Transcript_21935/m.51288 type:complete len:563 (-) Transcript_21935:30-1718(-)